MNRCIRFLTVYFMCSYKMKAQCSFNTEYEINSRISIIYGCRATHLQKYKHYDCFQVKVKVPTAGIFLYYFFCFLGQRTEPNYP